MFNAIKTLGLDLYNILIEAKKCCIQKSNGLRDDFLSNNFNDLFEKNEEKTKNEIRYWFYDLTIKTGYNLIKNAEKESENMIKDFLK